MMRMFAHKPASAMAMAGLSGAVRGSRAIGDRLAELTRLRIAFHNQCRSCMAIRYQDARDDGVDETLVCSLERPQESADLAPAEKVAVHYADLMATDHLVIDDVFYDELRVHFSEAQIVELGVHCAMCVGFGRLAATWRMVEELPERFQADDAEPLTPWRNEYVEVCAGAPAPVATAS